MTKRYLNDAWVLDDSLGIGRTGDQVATMALEVEPPFTMGVIGKWGSGKTSIMRRAFATLKGKPIAQAVPLGNDQRFDTGSEDWNCWAFDAKERTDPLVWAPALLDLAGRSLCVWYSPWQHQSAPNPLIPLLLEIKAQFAWHYKALETGTEIGRRVALAGLTLMERVVDAAASINLARPVKLATGTTEAVVKAWSQSEDPLTALSDGQRFHLLFEDAVETLLAGVSAENQSNAKEVPDARLIVFIDDLDRCEESVIVSLLEAIKLYLGSRRCVFVLGMDDGAVLGALKRHWKDRDRDGNREYLEKLLQCSLSIPLPDEQDVLSIVERILEQHKIPDAKIVAEHVAQLLEPNPRKIKNFVNGFCARWETLEFGKAKPDLDATVRFLMFHYLRQYHQPIWRLLERQPWALKVLWRAVVDPATGDPIEVPVDESSLKVMQQLMVREFAHVLKDNQGEANSHRGLEMSKVVDGLLERLDRKRSDDYFVELVSKNLTKDDVVEDRYLRLPRRPRP